MSRVVKVRVGDPAMDRLEALAVVEGGDAHELIRRAIWHYLEHHGTPAGLEPAPHEAQARPAERESASAPLSSDLPQTPSTASIFSPPIVPPFPEPAENPEQTKLVELDPFERFWERYPNKTAKRKAREKWDLHVTKPGVHLRLVLEGLGRWERSQRWADGYHVNPATWLQQHRWEESPEPAEQSRGHPAAERGARLLDKRRAEELLFQRRNAGEITEAELDQGLAELETRCP